MPSKSRNVNGYVKRAVRYYKLKCTLTCRVQKLEAMALKARDALVDAEIAKSKLIPAQLAEAKALINVDTFVSANQENFSKLNVQAGAVTRILADRLYANDKV